MIDPLNIKAISYHYKEEFMEILLHKPQLFDGFNRDRVKMKCDYEKFTHYLDKWMKIKGD